MKQVVLFLLIMMMAGCQVLGGDENDNGDNPVPQTNNAGGGARVGWERDPNHVVFRVEIVGGPDADAFYMRNHVPYCTIYGDNHMIWTTGGPGDNILFDELTDDQIVGFVNNLAVQYEIYNYPAEADLEFNSEPPVVEQITLVVDGQSHMTDAYGEWPPNYFEEIRQNCWDLSQSPQIFEPVSGWISAQRTGGTTFGPTQVWSAEATGVDLTELADTGERRWLDGRLTLALWRWIQSGSRDLTFLQDDEPFFVALEIPGVTVSSPDAPEADS